MLINWGGEPNFMDSDIETSQNWEKLSQYLEQHNINFNANEFRPKQFASGFGNLNYLILVNNKKAVLRRPPMGVIPPGANDMKREHHILSLSLIHISPCRRYAVCRSRWSPYH